MHSRKKPQAHFEKKYNEPASRDADQRSYSAVRPCAFKVGSRKLDVSRIRSDSKYCIRLPDYRSAKTCVYSHPPSAHLYKLLISNHNVSRATRC